MPNGPSVQMQGRLRMQPNREAGEGMPLLEMREIDKSFHGVAVLRCVSLSVEAGEVHALVGENGAGKSTLMRILCGALRADGGSVSLDGRPVSVGSPHEAQRFGIAMIHQELLLAPSLDAAENILLGRMPTRGGVFVDRARLRREAEEALTALGAELEPGVSVSRLTVAQRQMVAIARALSTDARVIVMDEPSAVLTEHELRRLFSVIERLAERGVAVIYISHRLDEVFRLARNVTVLKDGVSQGTHDVEALTKADVIRLMVGRDVEVQPRDTTCVTDDVMLRAEDIHVGRRVRGCSFALRRGEILGLAGLVGAGRTELARAIIGADRMERGRVWLDGRPVRVTSPAKAIGLGIAYISEDRKGAGVFPSMDVVDNVLVPSFRNAARGGFFLWRRARDVVARLARRLDIRASRLTQPIRTLSGGNQQKVILARWLNRDARVFIFDEPTRGIDVLAKEHIYDLMRDLVAVGASVLMISSELPELLSLSDRIIAMHEGRFVGELSRDEATEERVLALCIG